MPSLYAAMESIGQLQKDLKSAKEAQGHAEAQEAAGQRVLAQTVDQKNKLEQERDQQAEEIKSLKAQLSDALDENQKLKGGIFGMACGLHLKETFLVQ